MTTDARAGRIALVTVDLAVAAVADLTHFREHPL